MAAYRDDERVLVEAIMDTFDGFVRGGRVISMGSANWSAERVCKDNDYTIRMGKAGFKATLLFRTLAIAIMGG